MSHVAIVPPIPTTATEYAVKPRFLVGGPRKYTRDAVLQNGIPAETNASAALALPWSQDSAAPMHLDDASDFVAPGAVRLSDPAGIDFWFTYEQIDGNDLLGLNAVFQQRQPWIATQDHAEFPALTAVSQWYDISTLVDSWERDNHSAPGESWWTLSLDGHGLNSLRIYPRAAILAVMAYWDNILGEHDDHVYFAGYLGDPQMTGDPTANTWSVTCEGIRADLKLQRNTPGEVGGELLTGIWTVSDPLENVAAEPTEGSDPIDFNPPNFQDEDRTTLYISKDIPGATTLRDEPHGAAEDDFRLLPMTRLPNSNRGLKIQMAYINPSNNAKYSAQSQKFIVVQNTNDIEPPVQDDTEVGRGAWGYINLSNYHLELRNRVGSLCGSTAYPTIIYLGSKNGGPAPGIQLGPGMGAVLCNNEAVFRSAWSVPNGWPVIDLRQCGGEIWPRDPYIAHRGVGLAWDPDPLGCTIAIRNGGYAGNHQDDGRCFSGVVSDPGGTEIFLDPAASGPEISGFTDWPTKGYIRSFTSNNVVAYEGIDYGANKLFGCVRVKGNLAPLLPGEAVAVLRNAGYWWDHVAIGPDSLGIIPRDFPNKRAVKDGTDGGDVNDDGEFHDQNISTKGEKVWGIWGNGAASPIVWDDGDGNVLDFMTPKSWGSEPDARKYAPACPLNQAVRRKGTLGGGIFQQYAAEGASSWHHHDSNSWADWEATATPRIGNIDSLNAYITARYEAAEHEAAVVVSDDTEPGEYGVITVKTNQAREYPGETIPGVYFLRALLPGGGQVDFTYTHRTKSTFDGVLKMPGYEGVAIPPDSTLVKVINSKANWNGGGVDAWVQRNMPIGMGLSIERWKGSVEATILAYTPGTITVQPGQADAFPDTGTLLLSPPVQYSGGLTIIDVSFNPDTYRATYTGRTGSAFTGVTLLGGITPAAGWAVYIDGGAGVSYPADFEILGSREEAPLNPDIFLGNNESWDILYQSAWGNQVSANLTGYGSIRKFFPFAPKGINPFYRHYLVRFHRMSDGGRVKLNHMVIHKLPVRGNTAPFGSTNRHDWEGEFWTSTLVHDMFYDAGIPESQMHFNWGARVPRWNFSEGNLWDSGRGLAEAGGDLLTNTSDNHLYFRKDPQAGGAPFNSATPFLMDERAIWGDIEATRQPDLAVAQIRLEARNPMTGEQFTRFAPSSAAPFGEIRIVPNRIVANEHDADMLAGLLWRKANGGWVIRAPGGPFICALEYGDILRFEDAIDVAGRFFAQEMMVIGIHEEGEGDKLRCWIDIEEWVT